MDPDLTELVFSDKKFKSEKSDKELLAYWPASNIPIVPKIAIFNNVSTKKLNIVAESYIHFASDQSYNDEFNYFIATKDDDNRLVCVEADVHRMLPDYTFKDVEVEQEETVRLTKKEQFDELKEKFGSKRSQRDLASKRKYEIQFGEDDVDNLPTVNSVVKSEKVEQQQQVKEEAVPLSAILPQRNPDAKNVKDVYSLKDVILEEEELSIVEYEELHFSKIKNDYIKQLISKSEDKKFRIMAIYADLLLQMVKLSASELRKADPLPLVDGNIKSQLFERYASVRNSSRSVRYIITDQNKDRIYIYILLIIIILNDYKPIELEKIQSNCNIHLTHIRKIFELIGCYIETMKSASGNNIKVARLRLPLNVFKEPKSKRFKR